MHEIYNEQNVKSSQDFEQQDFERASTDFGLNWLTESHENDLNSPNIPVEQGFIFCVCRYRELEEKLDYLQKSSAQRDRTEALLKQKDKDCAQVWQ